MYKRIRYIPVLAGSIAAWTIIIGGLYVQYIKETVIGKKRECKYSCCNDN